MKKISLLFAVIPFMLQAQYGSITSGPQAQLTIPNLSTQQIAAIANPRHGSMVYDVTANCTKIYNGTTWKCTSEPLNNAPVGEPGNPSNAIIIEPGSGGTMGLPQLSDAQIKAIAAPKTGSIVYDKTAGCVRYYDGEVWHCTNQWKMNYPEAITAWKPVSEERFGGRIAKDADGNIIMAGTFVNSITFGDITLSSPGIQQIFCVKYSSVGHVIWAKMFTASNYSSVAAVEIGSDGGIYIAGTFTFTLDMGPIILNGRPNTNIFIARLDTNGNPVWARHITGEQSLTFNSMHLDKQNNPIITGEFMAGYVYLSGTNITMTTGENTTGFIAKCSAAGNFEWGRAVIGTSHTFCMSTAVDATGNIYVVGYFIGSITFPNGSAIHSMGECDIFVAKYQSNGTFDWVKREGTSTNEFGIYIGFTAGKLIVTGIAEGGTAIGGFNMPSQSTTTFETYYASMNVADQSWNWAFKADGYTYPSNLVLEGSTDFYMLGFFTNQHTTRFGNKSMQGDGGAGYLVKGSIADGSIKYFRKMISEGTVHDIVPLAGSKKLIIANTQYALKFGDNYISSPSLNLQSFIGIITE